jgi:hypothetical protein
MEEVFGEEEAAGTAAPALSPLHNSAGAGAAGNRNSPITLSDSVELPLPKRVELAPEPTAGGSDSPAASPDSLPAGQLTAPAPPPPAAAPDSTCSGGVKRPRLARACAPSEEERAAARSAFEAAKEVADAWVDRVRALVSATTAPPDVLNEASTMMPRALDAMNHAKLRVDALDARAKAVAASAARDKALELIGQLQRQLEALSARLNKAGPKADRAEKAAHDLEAALMALQPPPPLVAPPRAAL